MLNHSQQLNNASNFHDISEIGGVIKDNEI